MKKNHVSWFYRFILAGKSRILKSASTPLLWCIFALSQLFITNIKAQDSLLTIQVKDGTIAEVVEMIEEKSDYSFFFNNKTVNLNKPISVDFEQKSIFEILESVFKETDIKYEVSKKQIILTNKNDTSSYLYQSKMVTGKVMDEKSEPIPGVAVVQKGTGVGTTTDVNGEFRLNVGIGSGILQFTFLGMKLKEEDVSNQSVITVNMEPSVIGLDEVVAIGYGTMRKRDLTGSVASVKKEDLTRTPTANPVEGLQGFVPGLNVTKSSGQPGSEVTMQLRGTRSFTADGNPTIFIDGMPGDFTTVNPNDIESIEVLKDASATAIYGSAGANGVILVTTKSASAGTLSVSLNAFTGFNGWSTLPEMRDQNTYIDALRDANKATGNWLSPADDANIFASQEVYQAHLDGDYIDWPRELMQTAVTQNYSLAISSGTEKTRSYFSLNYSEEDGQFTGDSYRVYSSNIRVDNSVRSWLKVGANIQASYVNQDRAFSKLENALAAEPLGKIKDEDGNFNVEPVIGSTMVNLLLNTQEDVYRDQNQNFKMYINPYIEITPFKGFTFLSRIGGGLNYMRNNYFQGEGSYQYYNQSGASSEGTNSNVYAQITQNRNYNYKWENILTYIFDINEIHKFTITGVTSWEHKQYDGSWMKQTNIEHNKYLWYNMQAGSEFSQGATNYNMTKDMGLIGRLNYAYKEKYLLSATLRADGASRLAEDNRWDYFPAASLGWRISDEGFMEGTEDWLSSLKVRLGYGVTGTASIAPYSSISNLELGNTALGGQLEKIYMFSRNYANPNLSWEKSYNTNLGLDLTLFNGRVDFTADFYSTDTKGVIWSRSLPISSGGYDPTNPFEINVNLAETQNKGVEIGLNTVNVIKGDFHWNSNFTFSLNKEEIISLQDSDSDNIPVGDYTLSKGHPVFSYYQYKLDGVWQLGEEADAEVFGAKPGDLKINIPGLVRESEGVYTMEDEDGVVTTYNANNKYTPSGKDYQVIGHNTPDWTLGHQSTFTYKNFDASFFLYFRWGQMIKYNMLGRYDPTGVRNFPEYFNYWSEDNPSNDFPGINSSMGITNYVGSSALQYVDGSYFKIRNITLGYTLPKQVLDSWNISKFRVYATITNPLVVAKSHLLKDYDPEMNGEIDYPLTKQLVLGVNLTF